MLPIQDNVPARRYPVVMILIVAACVGAFLFEWSMPRASFKAFLFEYGIVPRRFEVTGGALVGALNGGYVPLLASIFLHGGWLHLLGNMWYLWIFGDNIEDRMGHMRFLIFYLMSGIVAGFVHIAMNPHSPVPAVGASGAIAGVLGAYLVTFPFARVLTLIPIIIFLQFIELPAFVLLGFWFLIQLLSGSASLGQSGGGVAWWAHIGGFLFGMIVGPLMMRNIETKPVKWVPERRRGDWIGRY